MILKPQISNDFSNEKWKHELFQYNYRIFFQHHLVSWTNDQNEMHAFDLGS